MDNIENKSIYEVLKERDLIKQIAFEDEFIEKCLDNAFKLIKEIKKNLKIIMLNTIYKNRNGH